METVDKQDRFWEYLENLRSRLSQVLPAESKIMVVLTEAMKTQPQSETRARFSKLVREHGMSPHVFVTLVAMELERLVGPRPAPPKSRKERRAQFAVNRRKGRQS